MNRSQSSQLRSALSRPLRSLGLQVTAHGVPQLVARYPKIAEFARPRSAAFKESVISDAELLLGKRFSLSYRWFLRTYGWGYLGGAPVYTIASSPAFASDAVWDSSCSNDIVSQHYLRVFQGADPSLVLVHRGTGGEEFFFDYQRYRFGECPIDRANEQGTARYAGNFYEFLRNRIGELRAEAFWS